MLVKTKLKDSKIYQAYLEKTPASAQSFQRARELFPSGVTHYGRHLRPYPLFVSHAKGSRKWDVDGNEYVDYFGGHGALILGHGHPVIVEAAQRQLARGTHYGAEHDLEIEWASLIREMVPSSETLRFTSSGTEATHLALRLARAYTRKPKLIRFAGHFHGWHDHVAFGASGPGASAPAGILKEIVEQVIVVEPNDTASVERILEERDDVAALMLEPTGASFGRIPTGGETLRRLRDITTRHGVVLIFDEVVTGFRCSPGGAQSHYSVTPDLTTLAKVVAGGLPGAVVTGRSGIFSSMDFGGDDEKTVDPAVPHQGTFNASPLSAAAGVAALKLLKDGTAIATANETAANIRNGMNAVLRGLGASWCVYGEFSAVHIFTNPERESITPTDILAGRVHWKTLQSGAPPELVHKIRLGFLCQGVDVNGWPGGLTSAVHDGDDVDRTVAAFEEMVKQLAEEGDLD